MKFVATYVHDSKVDFIVNLGDPFSYFSARGVQESTISIWSEAGGWIREKATAVSTAVSAEVSKGKQIVIEKVDKVTDTARNTADSVAQAARDKAAAAKRLAAEVAEAARRETRRAKQFGSDVIDEVANEARATAAVAQQRADQAVAYADKLAHEASKATSAAVETAKSRANAAGKTANKAAGDALDGVERFFDSGIVWVKNSVRDSASDDKPARK